MGMFGGYIVGVYMLDISPLHYIQINNESVRWPDIPKGLIKAAAFGLIITAVAWPSTTARLAACCSELSPPVAAFAAGSSVFHQLVKSKFWSCRA